MDIGILITPRTSAKGSRLLHAFHEVVESRVFKTYQPCDVLMLFGLGGADRLPVAEAHLAKGKPFITWDLAYWDRDGPDRKFRFSINHNHPRRVMEGQSPSPDRFRESGLPVTESYNPDGPIVLIGNGPKTNAVWSKGWTAGKSRELRDRFPGKKILYRPKPGKPIEPGVVYDGLSHGPIGKALKGASLVVCRHSNVAVDACRMGIPVVCDDGAAASIYPKELDGVQPDRETRQDFLNRLAWWQWSPKEAGEAWPFIMEKLCASI